MWGYMQQYEKLSIHNQEQCVVTWLYVCILIGFILLEKKEAHLLIAVVAASPVLRCVALKESHTNQL